MLFFGFLFVNIHRMKTLSDEVIEFLQATGLRQVELSRASGVSAPIICALATRKHLGAHCSTADALRAAMVRLSEGGEAHGDD